MSLSKVIMTSDKPHITQHVSGQFRAKLMSQSRESRFWASPSRKRVGELKASEGLRSSPTS